MENGNPVQVLQVEVRRFLIIRFTHVSILSEETFCNAMVFPPLAVCETERGEKKKTFYNEMYWFLTDGLSWIHS